METPTTENGGGDIPELPPASFPSEASMNTSNTKTILRYKQNFKTSYSK